MNRITVIYLVMADTSYEGSSPIRAFISKIKADDFIDKCNEYLATRPSIGNDDDIFLEEIELWQNNHVAGKDHLYADSFRMLEIELDKAVDKKESP